MMNVVRTTTFLLLLCILQSNAVPRFANYIQDHMVLQRAPQRAVVWGYGDAKTLTTLTMNGQTYTTISEPEPTNGQDQSIWSITLDPVSDEGPFDIHVSQPSANGTQVTITLHDVLFGDVWLCSGQSNMQLTVGMIYNATEEIANAGNFPKIRVFTAELNQSTIPLEEVLGIVLPWSVASPASIGGLPMQHMSAVCWIYGRMIHQALGGRPIGLLATSWAGTSIEVWMPPKAFQECNRTTGFNDNEFIIPTNHSSLFNSMIYPFTRLVIYGVIWDQGEANSASSNDNSYVCSFSKMIETWRQIWNQRTNGSTDLEFPFGFVQIGTETNSSIPVGAKAWIRWRQTFDVGYVPNNIVPKVFMAVTADLRDDPNGVHIRWKHDVCYRLSRAGLAVAYGQQIEFQGPIVQNVVHAVESAMINITYKSVSGLDIRNPNGFEVCCQGNNCTNDYIWLPSPIISKKDLTLTVAINSTCVGQEIYGVRYLWHETPCLFKQAAIYSATDANLPAPPYINYF